MGRGPREGGPCRARGRSVTQGGGAEVRWACGQEAL